jgi:hypothetical protein
MRTMTDRQTDRRAHASSTTLPVGVSPAPFTTLCRFVLFLLACDDILVQHEDMPCCCSRMFFILENPYPLLPPGNSERR